MAPTEDAGARWVLLMRRGDWPAAWALADAALRDRGAARRDGTAPRHLQAVWDGAPVAGRRVLVRCYHGLGDTIQFIRFLPRLRATAAATVVWAQPALLPLLRTMPDVGPLLPLHDGTPEADYDVDVEVMELAHLLRVTPAGLPPAPYLHPPRATRRAAPAGDLAIGLVWQAGDWDPRRSVPVERLAPLARIPGIRLHLLQRGAALAQCPPGLGVVAGAEDVLAAAGAMTALDLVLTVDSMPAHLAGAIGVPTWTMLPHDADWRWMEGRADSPWYPTMRLFRQPAAGDWAAVVAAVAEALRAALAVRRSAMR